MSIPLRTYFKASLRDASVHSWMLINFEASLGMLSSTCGLSCRRDFVETCMVHLNNYTERVYFRSSKINEWCIGRYKPFSLNFHLLKCLVIEDISRASIVN